MNISGDRIIKYRESIARGKSSSTEKSWRDYPGRRLGCLSNSEYIVMLNQAEPDRAKLATLLNISTEQMGYITNADAGCGLVKYGSSLVPFVNRFPTNTRLYKLMTTKPGEDSINRGRM